MKCLMDIGVSSTHRCTESLNLDSRQHITRIGANAITVGFVNFYSYRYVCTAANEAILCKASVYAPSRDFLVMTSENPGLKHRASIRCNYGEWNFAILEYDAEWDTDYMRYVSTISYCPYCGKKLTIDGKKTREVN